MTRFDDVAPEEYVRICIALRNAGIVAAQYLGSKKFGKQIEYALKGGYSHILIMGASEFAAGQIKIKALDTHEETTVSLEALMSNPKAFLA